MSERQELEDEYNASFGDPRRCPTHGIATSSPDGMFDAPCGACESEGEQAYHDELERERRAGLTQEEREAEDAQMAAVAAQYEGAYESGDDQPF
jgi:hypothetical protein